MDRRLMDYRALADFRFQLRGFQRRSEEAAHEAGIEPQQYQLLLMTKGLEAAGEEPSIKRLAERLHLKHHSVVGLADRLATKGLIVRDRGRADRRQAVIRLTPAGETLMSGLSAFHREVLRNLGPGLIKSLQTIIDAGDEVAPPG
jgi:DNA-binding MarR family transcriptional regulator